MKTKLVATLLILFALTSSAVAGRLSIGAKGGLNVSRFTRELRIFDYGPRPYDWYTSWGAAAVFQYEFGEVVSVRLAPGYSQRGYPRDGGDVDYTSYIDYVTVPLELRIRVPLRPVAPYVLAGPRLDFKLQTRGAPEVTVFFDKFDDISRGYVVGGGLEFRPRSGFTVFGEVTYDGRFGTIYDIGSYDWRDSAVDIDLGFRFDL